MHLDSLKQHYKSGPMLYQYTDSFVQVENQTSDCLYHTFWGAGGGKAIYLRNLKNNIENNSKPQEAKGHGNNCASRMR